MTAREDRIYARLAIAEAEFDATRADLPCGLKRKTEQFLDIRVRDALDKPVAGASVRVSCSAHSADAVTAQTDVDGDVIVRRAVDAWDVFADKDWHVPEPASQIRINLPANAIVVVTLTLDELRYYLHVDADRDGVVDAQHEGMDVIPEWRWGIARRGAIILCNPDRENRPQVIGEKSDIARIELRRLGPATAPSEDAGWTATLEILDDLGDKVRIFSSPRVEAQAWLGAIAPEETVARRVFPLRTPGLAGASYAGATLAMEAMSYACQGFDGLVRLKLTISRTGPNGAMSYFSGAQLRVAPWLMPSHLDDAHTVYVANLGADRAEGGRSDSGGNETFRGALNAALAGAALPGGMTAISHPDPDQANEDRWLQDCMEIGYSVLPLRAAPDGPPCYRPDIVLQTYRHVGHDDLKWFPRSLLNPNFGYQKSPGVAHSIAPKLLGGRQNAPIVARINTAVADAIGNRVLANAGVAAELAKLVTDTVYGSLQRWGMLDLKTEIEIREAINVHGAPWEGAAAEIANAVFMGIIFGEPSLYVKNASNEGGNLECTPPCLGPEAKVYPCGRIYFGAGFGERTFDAATRAFLDAQLVQAPIGLDVSWLELGHVDEMMSFIPAGGEALHNWRLLIASPARAYALLDTMADDLVVLPERQFRTGRGWNPVVTTVAGLRGGERPSPLFAVTDGLFDAEGEIIATAERLSAQQLRDYNMTVIQPRLNAIVERLIAEIGVVQDQVIQVPVIFAPRKAQPIPALGGGADVRTNLAVALTGDMVNMLVVNNHCVVPAAFGPTDLAGEDLFERDLREKIAAASPALTVTFINDWYTYHCEGGEIHCATNTLRRPHDLPGWLGTQAAQWWRFAGE